MVVAQIKNWVKKHKKGIILVAGSTVAATIGIVAFRDHYYIVPSKNDMYTIAKNSIRLGFPESIQQLGDVDIIWDNSENFNVSISNVPWDKLGEAGKTILESYKIKNVESVGIIITVTK